MRILLVSGLLPALLHAEYNPQEWLYRRVLRVESADRVQLVHLDAGTLRRTQQGLADLRIDFQGAEVPYVAERMPASDWIVVASFEAKAGDSVYEFDCGESPPPFERLRVEVDDGEFRRRVEVRTSDRRESSRYLGGATLSRLQGVESLRIDTGWNKARYLRLTVIDEDNPPLQIKRILFELSRWRVKFLPRRAGQYLLVYGNERARSPQYDLGAVLASRADEGAVEVTPEAEMRNPEYEPRVAWTERHPGLVYGILLVAVLALGVVAVRFFLRVRSESLTL
jgi:hypothetical protein